MLGFKRDRAHLPLVKHLDFVAFLAVAVVAAAAEVAVVVIAVVLAAVVAAAKTMPALHRRALFVGADLAIGS